MTDTSPAAGALDRLDAFLSERREALGVPGAALGIIAGDRAHVHASGVASVENPLPVTAETLFAVGSITKTITAAAVLRLVEDGRLDLDAPVRTYLPDMRLADGDAARRVTLAHLLTHTAGWEGDWSAGCDESDGALAALVGRFAELRQIAPPGLHFSYCNTGFILAGRVLEVATGMPYEAAVKTLVLDPVGMTSSSFLPRETARSFASGHIAAGGKATVAHPQSFGRAHNAAGGLVAPIGDLIQWARFALGDGRMADGGRLLSRETMARMRRPHVESAPYRAWCGMPWAIDEIGGVRRIGHGGVLNGHVAALEIVPDLSFAVAVLTNADTGGKLAGEVTDRALREIVGLESAPAEVMRAIDVPDDVLREYAGRYETRQTAFAIRVHGNGRLCVEIETRGYPTETSPPHRYPPEIWAFSAPDHAFEEDPPNPASRRVFVRDERGAVAWLRTSRLYPRIGE